MANLPLAFAELLVGAIVLDAGIKGASLADVVKGQATQTPLPGNQVSTSSTGSTSVGGVVGGSTPFSSNATSSRLDQGQDLTSSIFNAPVAGTVTIADQTNTGWDGGGYIALKLDQPITLADGTVVKFLYWAEGIAPTVGVGQHVSAGQQIGTPVTNPYNGIVGNIEWGVAGGANGGQPLAQLVSNAAAMVRAFYQWALSIGAPHAASTGNAGSA